MNGWMSLANTPTRRFTDLLNFDILTFERIKVSKQNLVIFSRDYDK